MLPPFTGQMPIIMLTARIRSAGIDATAFGIEGANGES